MISFMQIYEIHDERNDSEGQKDFVSSLNWVDRKQALSKW